MPSMTTRLLYTWHLLNGLIHILFESTYVYNCFTSYTTIISPATPPPLLPSPDQALPFPAQFLGHHDRLYGNAYADNLFADVWRVYAKADTRYAGVDLTTLSLEIITVFLAGPLALYVAECIRRDVKRADGVIHGPTWFWATVLASVELYGGLMNFLPEWLSGCESLNTADPIYFWFYIVFFNAIWVILPLWVLRCAYRHTVEVFRLVVDLQQQENHKKKIL